MTFLCDLNYNYELTHLQLTIDEQVRLDHQELMVDNYVKKHC